MTYGCKPKTRTKFATPLSGLGHIAQVAVLPAFAHAARNSVLTALVSDDPEKLRQLSRRYGVKLTYSYEQYDDCLRSGDIDAVYIALPNNMHAEYSIRAANAGVHVLCENRWPSPNGNANAMIRAARKHKVKLMIAYRLHFEEANLKAIEIVKSGKLGEPRAFNSLSECRLERETSAPKPSWVVEPSMTLGFIALMPQDTSFRTSLWKPSPTPPRAMTSGSKK